MLLAMMAIVPRAVRIYAVVNAEKNLLSLGNQNCPAFTIREICSLAFELNSTSYLFYHFS